ncbi:MAG TPA: tail fiber domain-containing protein [Chryseolinea sp.]
MKKSLALITLMTAFTSSAYSQLNTNYGTGTVATGFYNSTFGYYAGHDLTATGSSNSFFGLYAGRNTTSGYGNSFFGLSSGYSNTTGGNNTAIGLDALHNNETGIYNVAVGVESLSMNLSNHNTAVGSSALALNTTGYANTAIGSAALYDNLSGIFNTAVGFSAMAGNTTGSENTAHGTDALYTNETGFSNTAVGFQSLYNTTEDRNTAIGAKALFSTTTGHSNTASGYFALYENTVGYYNVASGSNAMRANISGNFNIAVGYYTMADNTTGSHNSASGFRALDNNTTGTHNTAHGSHALNHITTGTSNTALGYNAGPASGNLNNTTALGYLAAPTASNQVRVGNTGVTSIGGQVSWTTFSDGRFKKDIKEDVSGLDFINHLRPVSYVVEKTALDKFLNVSDSSNAGAETKNVPMRQTGFVAQEVEAIVKKTGYVFYGVDAPKNDNDHYGIRYAEFVVPLVKAVQELSTKVEEQQQQIQLLLAQLDSKDETDKKLRVETGASLFQNTPNPFDSQTEIKMNLPENAGHATIMVYSLEGKQMKNIPVPDRGDVSVTILANEFSAGMYIYALVVDGKIVDSKKMILTE